MNICKEIIKNYEQLLCTISKFQALFIKIEHYSSTFCRFFHHNRDRPNDDDDDDDDEGDDDDDDT